MIHGLSFRAMSIRLVKFLFQSVLTEKASKINNIRLNLQSAFICSHTGSILFLFSYLFFDIFEASKKQVSCIRPLEIYY